jgi:hypothetical protein
MILSNAFSPVISVRGTSKHTTFLSPQYLCLYDSSNSTTKKSHPTLHNRNHRVGHKICNGLQVNILYSKRSNSFALLFQDANDCELENEWRDGPLL